MSLSAVAAALLHGLTSLGHAAALLWTFLRGCLLVGLLVILLTGAAGCAALGWGLARLSADAHPAGAATVHVAAPAPARLPVLSANGEVGHA